MIETRRVIEKIYSSPAESYPEHIQIQSLRSAFELAQQDLDRIENNQPKGSKQWIFSQIFKHAIEARLNDNYGIAAALEYIPDISRVKTNSILLNKDHSISVPIPGGITNPCVVIFGQNNLAHNDPRAHAESEAVAIWSMIQRAEELGADDIQIQVNQLLKQGIIQVVEASPESLSVIPKKDKDTLIINTSLSPCPKCSVESINAGVDQVVIANQDTFTGSIHPSVEAYLLSKFENDEGLFNEWLKQFQESVTLDILQLFNPILLPEIFDYLKAIILDEDFDDKPWFAIPDLWSILFDNQHTSIAFLQSNDPDQEFYAPANLSTALAQVFDDHRVQLDEALSQEDLMTLSDEN